ncbi:MAG: carboxypeptidase-like regulatory domain-containing protein [Fibrobacterales bacterium]
MKILLALLPLFYIVSCAISNEASETSVTGIVVIGDTPVAAKITMVHSDSSHIVLYETESDSLGRYHIDGVIPDTYTLISQTEWSYGDIVNAVEVESESNTVVNVSLHEFVHTKLVLKDDYEKVSYYGTPYEEYPTDTLVHVLPGEKNVIAVKEKGEPVVYFNAIADEQTGEVIFTAYDENGDIEDLLQNPTATQSSSDVSDVQEPSSALQVVSSSSSIVSVVSSEVADVGGVSSEESSAVVVEDPIISSSEAVSSSSEIIPVEEDPMFVFPSRELASYKIYTWQSMGPSSYGWKVNLTGVVSELPNSSLVDIEEDVALFNTMGVEEESSLMRAVDGMFLKVPVKAGPGRTFSASIDGDHLAVVQEPVNDDLQYSTLLFNMNGSALDTLDTLDGGWSIQVYDDIYTWRSRDTLFVHSLDGTIRDTIIEPIQISSVKIGENGILYRSQIVENDVTMPALKLWSKGSEVVTLGKTFGSRVQYYMYGGVIVWTEEKADSTTTIYGLHNGEKGVIAETESKVKLITTDGQSALWLTEDNSFVYSHNGSAETLFTHESSVITMGLYNNNLVFIAKNVGDNNNYNFYEYSITEDLLSTIDSDFGFGLEASCYINGNGTIGW